MTKKNEDRKETTNKEKGVDVNIVVNLLTAKIANLERENAILKAEKISNQAKEG